MPEIDSSYREVFEAELAAIRIRLDAIDRATEVFNENLTRVPTDTDKQIGHLKELTNETFVSVRKELSGLVEGIALQFKERDVRTEQAAIATKIAVDAALQAQKEAAGAQNESNTAAITKSEAAVSKQIDALMALRQSDVKATDEKIADIKGRLDRGEGVTKGDAVGRGAILAYVVAAVSFAGLVITVLTFMLRTTHP